MGTGEAQGEGRALMAAENAIQNPLLDEVSLKGAKAVLVNITGGLDMTLLEVDEAANAISGQVDPEANIIFGAAFDPALDGVVRVSVVATGMDGASMAAIEPQIARAASEAPAPIRLAPEPIVLDEPEPAMAAMASDDEAHRPQAGFTFEEPASAPVVTLQPRIVEPVAAGDEEPLFAPNRYSDDRRQKGGWLSLFGGRRQEGNGAPARAMTSAQPAPEAFEDEEDEANEDLEIPSFLRRLAN
jgi:cell division protein FtsZ